MDASQQEILDIFTRTNALKQGHFVLRSGHHSTHYFQCAQVCQYMDAVERLGELLVEKLRAQGIKFTVVLAPAMGGLVIGQEIARRAKTRYLFAEKVKNKAKVNESDEDDILALRRNFKFEPGEPVLIVEDVVTKGGRARECLEIVKRHGGTPVAVAMLVDRSSGATHFEVPSVSLLELSFPTYPPDAIPESLAKIPIQTPGGTAGAAATK